MDLFVDQNNFRSFLSSSNPDSKDYERFLDCRRMITRQLDVHFNFPNPNQGKKYVDISSDGAGMDEAPVSSKVSDFFHEFSYGCEFEANQIVFDEDCNKSMHKVCIFDEQKHHDVDLTNVIACNVVGAELATLQHLLCGEEDYDFHKKYDLQSDESFPGWERLYQDGHCCPTSDIVIFDRYIYKNYNEKIAIQNIEKLCLSLIQNCQKGVNVVLYTLSPDNERKLFENYRQRLDAVLKGWCNITFVLIPELSENDIVRFKKIVAPHDRVIITNYRLFSSGDSFNYFNESGKKRTRGKSLDVDSLGKRENTVFARSIVEDLSKINKELISFEKQTGTKWILGPRCSNWFYLGVDDGLSMNTIPIPKDNMVINSGDVYQGKIMPEKNMVICDNFVCTIDKNEGYASGFEKGQYEFSDGDEVNFVLKVGRNNKKPGEHWYYAKDIFPIDMKYDEALQKTYKQRR